MDRPDWSDPRLVLLQERPVRHTLRQVYRLGHEEILKRFLFLGPGPHDRRRVWLREHRALKRLQGLATPRSLGYRRYPVDGGHEVVLRRTYVPGTYVDQWRDGEIEVAAGLVAGMHAQRVISSDLHAQNFLRGEDGRLWFIDFGRARVFIWNSPLMWYYLGRDLARFYRDGLNGDPENWNRFWPAYLEAARDLGLPEGLVAKAFQWHRRRYGV